MDRLPTGANGRGNGRINTQMLQMLKASPDRMRDKSSNKNIKKEMDTNGFSASTGITTIDRRPGRPAFHHMGPLPDVAPRQPDLIKRVNTFEIMTNKITKNVVNEKQKQRKKLFSHI